MACYIKKASDWAPNNSVILKNGGLTELPPLTVHQMAFDSKATNTVVSEDLSYFADLF